MDSPHPIVLAMLGDFPLLGGDERKNALKRPDTYESPFGDADIPIVD
jgi:hypothetical protein